MGWIDLSPIQVKVAPRLKAGMSIKADGTAFITIGISDTLRKQYNLNRCHVQIDALAGKMRFSTFNHPEALFVVKDLKLGGGQITVPYVTGLPLVNAKAFACEMEKADQHEIIFCLPKDHWQTMADAGTSDKKPRGGRKAAQGGKPPAPAGKPVGGAVTGRVTGKENITELVPSELADVSQGKLIKQEEQKQGPARPARMPPQPNSDFTYDATKLDTHPPLYGDSKFKIDAVKYLKLKGDACTRQENGNYLLNGSAVAKRSVLDRMNYWRKLAHHPGFVIAEIE